MSQELEGELTEVSEQVATMLDLARAEENELEEGLATARRRRQRLEKTFEYLTGDPAPGKPRSKTKFEPSVSDKLLASVRIAVNASEAVTVTEITETTGLHESSVRNALTILRDRQEIRKAGRNENRAVLYAPMNGGS